MSYEEIFKNAMTFKPDLSHWNVSDVACLESMFKDADLNQWDMEKYLESIRNTTVIRFTKEELKAAQRAMIDKAADMENFLLAQPDNEYVLDKLSHLRSAINNLTTEQGENNE